jgi:Zn-dependent M28 family amino/carboxypeptidase
VTKLRTCALGALALLTTWGCAEPSIERADVERIVTTLASDELRGRAAFSAEIDEAAEFLAAEFADIGLDPLPGEDGYVQAFEIDRVSVTASTVSVNGRTIADERVAVSASGASLSWTSPNDVQVHVIGPGEDLFAAFSEIRRAGHDILVLVAESHAGAFDRVANFLRRPNTVAGSRGQNAVWVLTNESDVRSLSVTASADVETLRLANVGGMIPGRRAAEIVLFSAHYDHIGIRPAVDGDSIANGANDNASGTTAVTALARYFQALGRPERTLMFVAFTAEERGGYGSQHFSEQVDPDQVVAMFNIEMIGKPATDGPNSAWITGFGRSDFGTILQAAVEGSEYRFYADPYPDQNLFYRSDNATLARLGVPAHSISTTSIDVDPDYHQVSDEAATLDLDHLTNTVRAIAAGARTIVSGEATPTRIDTTQVN